MTPRLLSLGLAVCLLSACASDVDLQKDSSAASSADQAVLSEFLQDAAAACTSDDQAGASRAVVFERGFGFAPSRSVWPNFLWWGQVSNAERHLVSVDGAQPSRLSSRRLPEDHYVKRIGGFNSHLYVTDRTCFGILHGFGASPARLALIRTEASAALGTELESIASEPRDEEHPIKGLPDGFSAEYQSRANLGTALLLGVLLGPQVAQKSLKGSTTITSAVVASGSVDISGKRQNVAIQISTNDLRLIMRKGNQFAGSTKSRDFGESLGVIFLKAAL